MPPHVATSIERDESAAVDRALMARDIKELRDDVAATNAELAKLTASIDSLHDAFKAAKFGALMVKWIGAVAVGAAAIWTAFIHHGGKL